jgi:hypothetical protein
MTLLNEAIPLCNSGDDDSPLCEQCGTAFTARSHSGGKPQRFCSPECRVAHASSQRNSSQQNNAQQNANETANKTPTLVTLGTLPEQDTSDDFDWSGEGVVIREQPATAIYFNPNGDLVIRQKAAYPDDDPFVYIEPDHIEAFLDKLCDLCGVPSVGKR